MPACGRGLVERERRVCSGKYQVVMSRRRKAAAVVAGHDMAIAALVALRARHAPDGGREP
jgi:predicted nucleic acid-binding Zn ribbon protein